jgi:hypothetical protein
MIAMLCAAPAVTVGPRYLAKAPKAHNFYKHVPAEQATTKTKTLAEILKLKYQNAELK